MENLFVEKNSIVRKIWGKADTILFIFAGAASEFALNKAVDWLYFTGRIPADPIGRLFSTVVYSQQIIFEKEKNALFAIQKITAIHQKVEENREASIPDWAYRDVLFLLIDYSIRSFEILDRKLTEPEKQEIFAVFNRVGTEMKLTGLPKDYNEWLVQRREHLQADLIHSDFTNDLYLQYKKHLGYARYKFLVQVQLVLVPDIVSKMLFSKRNIWIRIPLMLYKFLRRFKLEKSLQNYLLPVKYKKLISSIELKLKDRNKDDSGKAQENFMPGLNQ